MFSRRCSYIINQHLEEFRVFTTESSWNNVEFESFQSFYEKIIVVPNDVLKKAFEDLKKTQGNPLRIVPFGKKSVASIRDVQSILKDVAQNTPPRKRPTKAVQISKTRQRRRLFIENDD